MSTETEPKADEEIRVRIAEWMGIKVEVHPDPYFDGRLRRRVDYGCGWEWYDVNVLRSLDAIATAEAKLTDEQVERYCEHLNETSGADVDKGEPSFVAYFATARQRAIALLKTIEQ